MSDQTELLAGEATGWANAWVRAFGEGRAGVLGVGKSVALHGFDGGPVRAQKVYVPRRIGGGSAAAHPERGAEAAAVRRDVEHGGAGQSARGIRDDPAEI